MEITLNIFPTTPKSKFSVDDVPDLTGKVVIVTGDNNTGIGKEAAEVIYAISLVPWLKAVVHPPSAPFPRANTRRHH
jgi:hypothetical protein